MAAMVSEKMMGPAPSAPPFQSMDPNATAVKSHSTSPPSSTRISDASSNSSASAADTPDGNSFDLATSSPSSRQLDPQNQQLLRSEEYRQLFRLPPDEVLIQDFNCALQENFLLQGHMYLFFHYICFYSNLFGFETKKIIPFNEVTSVRRAKAAAIFPTAIEIIAGEKRYFFTSFLSRDEAFQLVNDGWLQHADVPKEILDQQELRPEFNGDEIESTEVANSSSSRDNVVSMEGDVGRLVNPEPEIVSTSSGVIDGLHEATEVAQGTDSLSSGNAPVWAEEDSDAPHVPECYTMVAESKFAIKVKDFFDLFLSDDAVGFQDSFHRKCGDKDFRCTSWTPHEKFGYTRDASFQHPIKLYFGAKFGSCQELQKFRVYKNEHMVFETSQNINDVPYGDYFCVEGRWDIERDGDESNESCKLRVYTNVAFSRKTMFKGKIVQSTVEECRDAYATWIELAHDLLKKKHLEREEATDHTVNTIPNDQNSLENPVIMEEHVDNSVTRVGITSESSPDLTCAEQEVVGSLQGRRGNTASLGSLFRNTLMKFYSSLKGQSHVSLLLVMSLAVILLLMQITILVLLSRPQQIHVISPSDYTGNTQRAAVERGAETLAILDKQINHLKEEVHMVETILEKMRHEHLLLKGKLKDLELLRKPQKW